jgi:hypothetical protein
VKAGGRRPAESCRAAASQVTELKLIRGSYTTTYPKRSSLSSCYEGPRLIVKSINNAHLFGSFWPPLAKVIGVPCVAANCKLVQKADLGEESSHPGPERIFAYCSSTVLHHRAALESEHQLAAITTRRADWHQDSHRITRAVALLTLCHPSPKSCSVHALQYIILNSSNVRRREGKQALLVCHTSPSRGRCRCVPVGVCSHARHACRARL